MVQSHSWRAEGRFTPNQALRRKRHFNRSFEFHLRQLGPHGVAKNDAAGLRHKLKTIEHLEKSNPMWWPIPWVGDHTEEEPCSPCNDSLVAFCCLPSDRWWWKSDWSPPGGPFHNPATKELLRCTTSPKRTMERRSHVASAVCSRPNRRNAWFGVYEPFVKRLTGDHFQFYCRVVTE